MKFNPVRFTNLAILATLAVLGLSGVYGLFFTRGGWVFDIHRLAGWIFIALIPAKVAISWKSLQRGLAATFDRGAMILVSLALAAATILVVLLGVAWNWRLGAEWSWLGQTVIAWHWLLGLGLIVPLILHIWRRWPHPKKVDFASRRAFLKMLVAGGVGLAGWRAAEALAALRSEQAPARRFTGSREAQSFAGNFFPVTNNPGEGGFPIDAASWRLVFEDLNGSRRTITYQELLALPILEVEAAIDCTLGWYSTHRWRGIPFNTLLNSMSIPSAGTGVELISAAGFMQIIPLEEARQILLATYVDGQPLDSEHGFPLRAVVPTRRGWFWVKWLSQINLKADYLKVD